MNANINEAELSLLAWMHENAEGYNESFPLDMKTACKDLNLEKADFKKHLSYLSEHGLAGMETIKLGDTGHFSMRIFWLSGAGEDYARELEAKPGLPEKLTVAAVKRGWEFIKDTAIEVLTKAVVKSIVG